MEPYESEDLKAILAEFEVPVCQVDNESNVTALANGNCKPPISGIPEMLQHHPPQQHESTIERLQETHVEAELINSDIQLQNGYEIAAFWQEYRAVRYKDEQKIRRNGKTINKQKIRNDDAIIHLNVQSYGYTNILVYIQRVKTPNCSRQCNAFKLECQPPLLQNGMNLIQINLNSVYEIENEKVYELPTVNVDASNNFQLLVWTSDHNGLARKLIIVGPSFKIVGKEKKSSSGTSSKSKKLHLEPKKRSSSAESTGQSTYFEESCSSTGSASSTSRIDTLVSDSIDTKLLMADQARFRVMSVNQSESSNGDIAYHIKVHRDDKNVAFHEGQIVALVFDEEEKTVLKPVSRQNINMSLCKGVISRSQYLSAHYPQNGKEITETVCFMGLVPILVRGIAHAQDRIFPCLDCAGTAISERSFRFNKEVYRNIDWVGTAWETVIPDDENEISLVECYIQLGSQFIGNHLKTEIVQMTNDFQTYSESRRKSRRCCYIASAIACVMFSLIACFLWQLETPGSAYNLWRCQHGIHSDEIVTFKYRPFRSPYQYYPVEGEKVSIHQLEKKVKEKVRHKKGVNYFLNLKQCSYRIVGIHKKTKDISPVVGPIYFAVDKNCSEVFFWKDIDNEWAKYVSAIELKCQKRNKIRRIK